MHQMLLFGIYNITEFIILWLPKPRVAGSNPVFRSSDSKDSGGFGLSLFFYLSRALPFTKDVHSHNDFHMKLPRFT